MDFTKKFKAINIGGKKKEWGERCLSMADISKVFTSFLQGKIKKFPFSEGTIALETADISEILVRMNQNKLLTINSQPAVNSCKSTDAKYGWGPKGGYVYQKAYVELFLHEELLQPFLDHLKQFSTIAYQAINARGQKHLSVGEDDVNAVTWGVFPNKEIMQPTVVDHRVFEVWKDEAFKPWTDAWPLIYMPTEKDGMEVPADE